MRLWSLRPQWRRALCFAGSAAAQVTALTNATVIDGTGAAPQSGVTIVMQNGRIAAIGRDVKAPAGAAIVDLAGKFVVPGIINGHGHVGPAPHERQVRQYALYGVTTTTSMASDPDEIAEYKARTRAGDIRGARVLTVMYRFTTSCPATGYDYKTPEAARGKVDEIAAKGADLIKVWVDPQGGRVPRLSREFVSAVFDQARKHNRITGAHIVELADANMVIDEGVRILLHNVRDQEVGADFIAPAEGPQHHGDLDAGARGRHVRVRQRRRPGFTDNPFFTKSVPPERLDSAHHQDQEGAGDDDGPRARHPCVRDRQGEPQEDGRRRRPLRLRHRFRRRSQSLFRAGVLRAPADGTDAGRPGSHPCR